MTSRTQRSRRDIKEQYQTVRANEEQLRRYQGQLAEAKHNLVATLVNDRRTDLLTVNMSRLQRDINNGVFDPPSETTEV